MNIYKIWQDVNKNDENYDSAIVAAVDEESARLTHPSSLGKNWNGIKKPYDAWCNASDVHVEFIGTTNVHYENKTVILASFNGV